MVTVLLEYLSAFAVMAASWLQSSIKGFSTNPSIQEAPVQMAL